MTRYPIFFSLRRIVAGDGFVAGVNLDGRALLVESEDEVWIYGVNPGGIAGGGGNLGEAQEEFRLSFESVLFDAAEEAESFEALETEMTDFYAETNEPNEAEWEAAHRAVEEGKLDADWLTRQDAEKFSGGITVERLEHPKAQLNKLDQKPELAA